MRSFRYILVFIAVCLAGAVISCALFYRGISPLPVRTFADVESSYKKSDACLLDRHGRIIQELRVDFEGRRLDWAGLKDISPVLVESVIQSEDKRFYRHNGVDWIALFSAAIKDVVGRRGQKRGASTITMQLASILNDGLRPAGRRDVVQKIKQIKTALEIERRWDKKQVLEAYLNLVTFRGELQGVTAASEGLFGKTPSALDWPESLILASLIRAPNAPATQVITRADALSMAMGVKAKKDEISGLVLKALSGPYDIRRDLSAGLAFHAASMLLSEKHPRVVSTLDRGLQEFAAQALQQYVGSLRNQNVTDGAVLVLDNRTGEVLAYVANMGAHSPDPFVDGIQAKRQAGSTLKPFLYALAFDKRILTPAALISDRPLDVSTGRGIYSPENYDKRFRGLVTAREALASSLNIPAVRTGMLVGEDAFVDTLEKFGFKDLHGGDFYGPSLALGTADISLWELTNAYRALSRGGLWSQAVMLPGQKHKSSRAASEEGFPCIRYPFGQAGPKRHLRA